MRICTVGQSVGESLRSLVVTIVFVLGPAAIFFSGSSRSVGQSICSTDSSRPTYDVAAIRENRSEESTGEYRTSHGRFTAESITLQALVEYAYGIKDFQIVNAPDWFKRERFDMSAETQNATILRLPYQQRQHELKLMLQTLIEQRFRLTVHCESRRLPIYDLIVSKKRTKLISKDQITATSEQSESKYQPSDSGTIISASDRLIGHGVSLDTLSKELSQKLDRDVQNKTGLAGNFDFTLRFSPVDLSDSALLNDVNEGHALQRDNVAPSLFTALQEQLGLKLVAAKGLIEVLVVDRVEQPSDN